MEDKVKKLMKNLDITENEALQLLKDDEEDFIGEQGEEMSNKAKKVETPVKRGRKPRKKGEGMAGVTTQKRVKKENSTKATIIDKIAKSLQDLEGAEIDIKNTEKTIFVKIGEDTFEIDLKQKRKPKME